jgi:phosphatidylcholine synthase
VRENVAPPAASEARGTTDAATPDRFPLALRLAGAAVHLYTASGSVLGLLIVLAAFEGEVATALWLGLATLFIDGTDGMLARRFRVKETIPWFDGARLDDIVDYLTYVFAPVVLLWTTGHLPEGPLGWALVALPLLASCYQFCRVDAKTSDHFFLGFPSYWNIVAFYVIVLDVSDLVSAVTIVVFAVLVFVPIRYLYPSRTRTLQGLTLALTLVWLIAYAVLVVQLPDPNPWVVAA